MDLGKTNSFNLFISKHGVKLLYFLFALLILVEGFTFSKIVPFGQTPDEIAHYEMIEEEFGTSGYVDEMTYVLWYMAGYGGLPRSEQTGVNTVAAEAVSGIKFTQSLSITDFKPNIRILRHLPAGLGFYAGIALGLPMASCARLAEILTVLFFVVMSLLTVWVAPVKKEVFALTMLLPTYLQQCTSINYDSVLLPCCLFLFAYILKLYYSEDKVRWGNMALILALSLVILVTKPPYILILISMFIIPLDHYELKIGSKFELAGFVKKYIWFFVAAGVAMVAMLFYIGRNNPDIKTIMSDIFSPLDFLRLLKRTFFEYFLAHIRQVVGVFGWLDSGVSVACVVIVLLFMVYVIVFKAEKTDLKLNVKRRLILLLSSFGVFMLIEIALQSWTYLHLGFGRDVGVAVYKQYMREIPHIMGIQGRYWLPCVPITLIALSGNKERKYKWLYFAIQFVFYVGLFIYVTALLYERYWAA
ncbi:MAG: DUF2142 domain-containing protein [Lachnospiraceae bacterium]|nr:DUF2142 domain-containing protein [Lachnospiraceae bacterium]